MSSSASSSLLSKGTAGSCSRSAQDRNTCLALPALASLRHATCRGWKQYCTVVVGHAHAVRWSIHVNGQNDVSADISSTDMFISVLTAVMHTYSREVDVLMQRPGRPTVCFLTIMVVCTTALKWWHLQKRDYMDSYASCRAEAVIIDHDAQTDPCMTSQKRQGN